MQVLTAVRFFAIDSAVNGWQVLDSVTNRVTSEHGADRIGAKDQADAQNRQWVRLLELTSAS